jgi:Bacteriophage HK97-gp10, putative tail-component
LARGDIQWDDQISPRLQNADRKVNDFLKATVQQHAPQVEASAKRNAPWRDRTGNARSGLRGVAESSGNTHKIILAHGVPYGIYLEVRFSGKYSIINKTIATEGPQVMRTVQGGLDKIFR